LTTIREKVQSRKKSLKWETALYLAMELHFFRFIIVNLVEK